MKFTHCLVAGSMCIACSALAQELFKSVGPGGRVVYSDRRPTDGRVEKTMKIEQAPSSALPDSTLSYVEQLRRLRASASAKAGVAAPTAGIVLFTAPWCRYCTQAKEYLADKGLRYQEHDIDTAEGIAEFARVGGGKGVPLLVSGKDRVRGYSVASYDALFAGRQRQR